MKITFCKIFTFTFNSHMKLTPSIMFLSNFDTRSTALVSLPYMVDNSEVRVLILKLPPTTRKTKLNSSDESYTSVIFSPFNFNRSAREHLCL